MMASAKTDLCQTHQQQVTEPINVRLTGSAIQQVSDLQESSKVEPPVRLLTYSKLHLEDGV